MQPGSSRELTVLYVHFPSPPFSLTSHVLHTDNPHRHRQLLPTHQPVPLGVSVRHLVAHRSGARGRPSQALQFQVRQHQHRGRETKARTPLNDDPRKNFETFVFGPSPSSTMPATLCPSTITLLHFQQFCSSAPRSQKRPILNERRVSADYHQQ